MIEKRKRGRPRKKTTEVLQGIHGTMELRFENVVDHPSHYTSHPSGIEAITICEQHNFNIDNALKYLWRAGLKGDAVEDMKKARWYLDREIERITKAARDAR